MSNRPSRQNARRGQKQAGRPQASTATADAGSKTWWWVGGGLALVVAAALVIAIAVGGDDTSSTSADGEEVAFAEVTSTPLPPFQGSQGDPAVGMVAPDIRASEFDGTQHQLAMDDGTARVVGFFAHWCPHCQAELPRLVSWFEQNDLPSGVEVVAISTSVDSGAPNYPPSAWFEREGWQELVLRDSADSAVARVYGLAGFPFFTIVGADGSVMARVSGELTVDDWEALVALAASTVG